MRVLSESSIALDSSLVEFVANEAASKDEDNDANDNTSSTAIAIELLLGKSWSNIGNLDLSLLSR